MRWQFNQALAAADNLRLHSSSQKKQAGSGQLATQPAQNDASQPRQQLTLKDPRHSNAVAIHDVTAVPIARTGYAEHK